MTEFLDLGQAIQLYADGIADVYTMGPMAHLSLWHWRKLDGVLRKEIVAHVRRPITSVTQVQLAMWQQAFGIPQPNVLTH